MRKFSSSLSREHGDHNAADTPISNYPSKDFVRPKHSDSDTVAPVAAPPFTSACFRPGEGDKKMNVGQ